MNKSIMKCPPACLVCPIEMGNNLHIHMKFISPQEDDVNILRIVLLCLWYCSGEVNG